MINETQQEFDTSTNTGTQTSVKKTLPVAILLFFVLTFVLAVFLVKKSPSEENMKVPQAITPENKKSNMQAISASYEDGTYTSEGLYISPVGEKRIKVVIELKSNTIADVIVANEADDDISKKFQDMFISGYKEMVVGKNINDLQLTKVSGSSLTPIGFNNALEKIKEQAKI